MKRLKYCYCIGLLLVFSIGQATPKTTKVFQGYKLEAKYTDEMNYPVVGIEDGTPIIYSPDGIVNSGRRFIKVSPVTQINDLFVDIQSVEEKRTDKAIILKVRLKSSDQLENPYALIIYTDEKKGQLRCKYDDIAGFSGQDEKIILRFNSNKVPESGWQLHFFNGQRQLYTNQTADLRDAQPEQAFVLHLGRHISSVGSGDANPSPFYMPIQKPGPELLPEGNEPVTIKVKLTIETTGRVGDFNFVDPVEPDLKAYLSKSVRQWLFFPRILAGKREPVTVVLPVKLR